MLWSSDCEPVLRCTINQTDWIGQIWFVIAQKKGEGETEKWITVSYVCTAVFADVQMFACVCCVCVQRCGGVYGGGSEVSAAVCLRVRGQINGT